MSFISSLPLWFRNRIKNNKCTVLTGGYTLTCTAQRLLHKLKFMDSQLNPLAAQEYARKCSNMLLILSHHSADAPLSSARPWGYQDEACWVIKVPLKWSLGSVLDPQGLKAARFPQFLSAALIICNPLFPWPKALIRISNPEAPGA